MQKKNFLFVGLLAVISLIACDTINNSSSSLSSSDSISFSNSENESNDSSYSSARTSKGGRSIDRSNDSSSDTSNYSSSRYSSSSSRYSSSSSSKYSSYTTSSYPSTSYDGNEFRWNVNYTLKGEAFRSQLEGLMKSIKKTSCSYNNCLNEGAKAAAYPVGSSKFIPFYHSTEKIVTVGQCNREHTWPNSRGTGKNGFNDPFIIRPTISAENNSRGNYFYGLNGSNEWDPGSLGFPGARGESARVIFYTATMYASQGLTLSNNPGDSSSLKTMGTLKYLIQWNKQYPVTDMERQINDYYYSKGYGRNPFVDNPEFANYIWNENGVITQSSALTKEDDINSLPNNTFAIVGSNSNESNYYALSTVAPSTATNGTLTSNNVTTSVDLTKMNPGSSNISMFRIIKSGSYYTFYNETVNDYLYAYNNAGHSGIYIGNPNIIGAANTWSIVRKGNGVIIRSTTGCYLSCSNDGTFMASSSEPSTYLYLYRY